jgi:hypothetical protein
MYKPGTQLIMSKLRAAAAAHELGFKVDSNPNNSEYVIKNDVGWVLLFLPNARVWRITVTESGPNAAERFLPQRDDVVDLGDGALRLTGEIDETTNYSPCGDFWPLSEVRRIIERNGIPFPQFSEVIEP